FLLSLMSGPPVHAGIGRPRLERTLARALAGPHREPVRVAQVDVIDALARPGEGLGVHRDEARDPILDAVALGVAPELHRDAVRELHLPGEARGEQHLRRREAERSKRVAESKIAPDDLGLAARRPGEKGKRLLALPGEQLALGVDELGALLLLAPP